MVKKVLNGVKSNSSPSWLPFPLLGGEEFSSMFKTISGMSTFALDRVSKNPHNSDGSSPISLRMNRQKREYNLKMCMPSTVKRAWCNLFGWLVPLCLFASATFANDFGLGNPAEKEFGEYKSETKQTGSMSKKTPELTDRSLPTFKSSEKIRQVSASESADDPFPTVLQPLTAPSVPLDGETPPTAALNNPLVAQNYVLPYDPNVAFGIYANPYAVPPHAYPTGAEIGYFSQSALYPQQYPYANVYVPYGNTADPYTIGYLMDYPTGYQDVPDYSSAYQALMFQEMMRQQAGAAQGSAGSEKDADEAKKQTETNWTLNNLVPVRVSSPLGETLLVCAKTVSPFSTPKGPDKGVGMPLVNKSWLDHPYYFGGFVGSMSGSELVSTLIEQKSGGTGGLIFGYNFNDYWGLESRLHVASIDIYDTDFARQLITDLYPELKVLPTTRTNELTVIDAAVHYYPLGNAKWRPYVKYGLGVGRQKFVNTFGYSESADIITMPLGVGVRYWWNERIAIQADLLDNMVFASGIAKTQNNIAFTVGLTYAFGSSKKSSPVQYWPATPSMGSKW